MADIGDDDRDMADVLPAISDLQFRNCTSMSREAVIVECRLLTFHVCTHMGNENPRQTQ